MVEAPFFILRLCFQRRAYPFVKDLKVEPTVVSVESYFFVNFPEVLL